MMSVLLCQGTALHLPLRDASVHCCVTSPPYYGLRDYGIEGQMGLEATIEEYLRTMIAVFREVWRVLRYDGTCWVNIGDSYNSARGGMAGNLQARTPIYQRGETVYRGAAAGLKEKDLCMVPARLALALQSDGWYLRSEIIWQKPNPMPESVTDRPTRAHEQVFLLSKSPQYFYDAEAVKEPTSLNTHMRSYAVHGPKSLARTDTQGVKASAGFHGYQPEMRNIRTVWSILSEPTPFAHFATFPRELARRCILAGTSAHGCCAACGTPYVRQVTRQRLLDGHIPVAGTFAKPDEPFRIPPNGIGHYRYSTRTTEHGWQASCPCEAGEPVPCRVLDPFVGSGTTLIVTRELGRHGVGIDLSWPYLHDIGRARLGLADLARWEGRSGPFAPAVAYEDLPLFGGS